MPVKYFGPERTGSGDMSIYIFFNTGSPLLNLKFELAISPEPNAFGEKYFAALLRGCTGSFWLNIKKIVQDLILNLLFNS